MYTDSNTVYIVTDGMKAKGKCSTMSMSSNLEDGTVTIFPPGIEGIRSDHAQEDTNDGAVTVEEDRVVEKVTNLPSGRTVS